MEAQLLRNSRASSSIAPTTAKTAVVKSTAAEQTLATVNIAAGQIVGRTLNVFVSCTNTNTLATVRTWKVKLGGTVVGQFTQNASNNLYSAEMYICDRGDNTQRGALAGINGSTQGANAYTAAIDTTAATTLTITAEIASIAGSETTTLEFYCVELIS